jgi:hypothetical protein
MIVKYSKTISHLVFVQMEPKFIRFVLGLLPLIALQMFVLIRLIFLQLGYRANRQIQTQIKLR